MTRAFDNLTLSQRVYQHLREEILSDRLPPGTELSEVAISTELAISRGPIREAMGRLAAEGLINIRPRRRAEVRSLTPQELIDAYEVREALEVLAVRLAVPRVTEADLTRLDQLIDQMADHAKRTPSGTFRGERRIPRDTLRAERELQAARGASPAGRRDRQVPGAYPRPSWQPGRVSD